MAWCNENEWLWISMLVVLLLRIPSWFEPNRYADEDIYLVLGQALRKGLVFYRDIHDNKPPLLYVMAGLAGSVRYFRLLLTGWNLVNVWLVWEIGKKIMKKTWVRVVVTMLFGVLSSIPLTEGNIANGEIFMIMPVTAAVWLILKAMERKKEKWMYWWAGVAFAMAFLFKVPAGFDMVGIVLWLVWWKREGIGGWIKGLGDARAWILGIGFLIPVGLSIAYYFGMGAGEAYVKAALGQNLGYVSSWEGGAKPIWQSGLFLRGMILLGATGVIFLLRKKVNKYFGLMVLWSVWALFGANLSGRPYPHYLIEVIPGMVLMVGVMLDEIKNWWQWGVGLMVAGMLVGAIKVYDFWYYKSVPYYENFVRFVSGKESEEEYFNFFGGGVNRNLEVARYINMRTEPNEKIYVWGTEPAIYAMSDRLPVGRYTVSYHVRDFDGYNETIEKLKEEKPNYIVIMRNESLEFPALESLVTADYVPVKEIGEAVIYRRVESN